MLSFFLDVVQPTITHNRDCSIFRLTSVRCILQCNNSREIPPHLFHALNPPHHLKQKREDAEMKTCSNIKLSWTEQHPSKLVPSYKLDIFLGCMKAFLVKNVWRKKTEIIFLKCENVQKVRGSLPPSLANMEMWPQPKTPSFNFHFFGFPSTVTFSVLH